MEIWIAEMKRDNLQCHDVHLELVYSYLAVMSPVTQSKTIAQIASVTQLDLSEQQVLAVGSTQCRVITLMEMRGALGEGNLLSR